MGTPLSAHLRCCPPQPRPPLFRPLCEDLPLKNSVNLVNSVIPSKLKKFSTEKHGEKLYATHGRSNARIQITKHLILNRRLSTTDVMKISGQIIQRVLIDILLHTGRNQLIRRHITTKIDECLPVRRAQASPQGRPIVFNAPVSVIAFIKAGHTVLHPQPECIVFIDVFYRRRTKIGNFYFQMVHPSAFHPSAFHPPDITQLGIL